jgi:Protein of unknown function (DUF2975)
LYHVSFLKLKNMEKYFGSKLLLQILHVIAWIIFVGLSIEAGALIVNFIFSIFKPELVGNLYQKMDLRNMYEQNKWAFYGVYGFIIFISILKATLFYTVIQLLLKLDLSNPFNGFVAKKISKISSYAFSIGIISHIAKEITQHLSYSTTEIDKLQKFWVDSHAFILMAGIIYIIAVIFKKGIELQTENDLTV